MTSERSKRLVVAASAIVSVGVGFGMWSRAKSNAPLVQVLDNRVELEALLAKESEVKASIPPLSVEVLLPRKPWSPKLASKFFPMLSRERSFAYDKQLGCRRTSNFEREQRFQEHPAGRFMVRTNSMGLRDDELLEEPEVRILFAGDSQTEGVCESQETFIHLLESSLRARHSGHQLEAVNAAMGGSDPWRYLATLEAFTGTEPDIFAPVFYGGNDFREVMALERFYRGRKSWQRTGIDEYLAGIEALPKGMAPVELRQLQYFLDNPDDVEVTVQVWTALAMEMSRQCAARGIGFFPVYLPPPLQGQPLAYGPDREQVETHLPRVAEAIELSSEMADRWIAELGRRGVQVIDLRPALRDVPERLFWEDGYHLNLRGNAVVAGALEGSLGVEVAGLLVD